jgi:transposase-like protein
MGGPHHPESAQVKRRDRNYQPNRRLTPAELVQLAEQYQPGLSALELARQYGINRHTVTKHLREEGIIIRGGRVKLTTDKITMAARLYASGQSLADVAENLGVDPTTVHKQLRKHGTKMRDTHGRPI